LEHHRLHGRWHLMRALSRPVRPIVQAFESVALITHQPPVHRSPGHAPVRGHLAHCPTIANNRQDRLVPLLSHAHLPHARERDKSPEVGVTHQPKLCDASAEGLLGPVSRTCTIWWLGRKDSNLQPSDPESAALPLRHSPNLWSGPAAYSSQRPNPPLITGFPHAFHTCGRLPANRRLPVWPG